MKMVWDVVVVKASLTSEIIDNYNLNIVVLTLLTFPLKLFKYY